MPDTSMLIYYDYGFGELLYDWKLLIIKAGLAGTEYFARRTHTPELKSDTELQKQESLLFWGSYNLSSLIGTAFFAKHLIFLLTYSQDR